MHTFGTGARQPLKILATGSAGLDRETLPDHPNQYQIVRIENRNVVEVVMRQYSAQTFGLAGQGCWIVDGSLEESGVMTFSLGEVRPKPGSERKAAKPSLADARKRLLNYLGQEHRFLQLKGFGTDIRVPLELEPIYISLRAVPAHMENDWPEGERVVGPKGGTDTDRPRNRREPSGTSGPARRDGPTTDPRQSPYLEEMEIGPALTFCEQRGYSGMVVLGDPGSGKSTLLKYLTLCLAQRKPAEQTGVRNPRSDMAMLWLEAA